MVIIEHNRGHEISYVATIKNDTDSTKNKHLISLVPVIITDIFFIFQSKFALHHGQSNKHSLGYNRFYSKVHLKDLI